MALVAVEQKTGDAQISRGRSLVVVAPRERQIAVRSARRHSILVKALRVLLPVAAIALISSYGIYLQPKIAVSEGDHVGTFDPGQIRLSLGQPTMHNPKYEGFNQKDGSSYTVRADRAITDLSESKPVDLFGISGELLQKDGLVTNLVATEGQYDRKSGLLRLFKGIDVKTSSGMAARLANADVETKTGIIRSKNPVSVRFPNGSFRGNEMLLKQRQRQVLFSKGVLANLKPSAGKTGADANAAARRPASGLSAFMDSSNSPITVVAQSLRVDNDSQRAQFVGDVRANQDEAQLTSRVLDISYGGNAGSTATQTGTGNLERIVARENVVITRGPERIVSATAEFDVRTDRAVLDGDVVVTSTGGRRVLARRAEIDTKKDTVLLTGNVTVVQEDNQLRGGRLLYDQRNGILQLSRPGAPQNGAGRISAKFANPRPPGSQSQKTSKPSTGGFFAGQSFQTNPNAPITVEAERLTANEKSRIVVFNGDVVARQDTFSIQTSVLRATYLGAPPLALGDAQKTARAQQPGASLETIEAPNRVIVRSDGGRSAEGDTGKFDLQKNEVRLAGNVVLKQGRQVIRGARLRIDLSTGLTRMETGAGPAVSAVQRGSSDTSRPARFEPKGMSDSSNSGACGGRMCAMFFPNELQRGRRGAQAKPKKPQVQPNLRSSAPVAAPKPEISSGWSAAVTNGASGGTDP